MKPEIPEELPIIGAEWRAFCIGLRAGQKNAGYARPALKGSFKDLKTIAGLAFGSTVHRKKAPVTSRKALLIANKPDNTPPELGPGAYYDADRASIDYCINKKITSTKGGIMQANEAKRGQVVYEHLLGNPSSWDYNQKDSKPKQSGKFSKAPRKFVLTDIKNNNPAVGTYSPEKAEIGKSLPTTEAFGSAHKVIAGTTVRCMMPEQVALQKCMICNAAPKNSYYVADKPCPTYLTEKQFERLLGEVEPIGPDEKVVCSLCYKNLTNLKHKYEVGEFLKQFKRVSGCAQYHDHSGGLESAVTNLKTYQIPQKKRLEGYLARYLG